VCKRRNVGPPPRTRTPVATLRRTAGTRGATLGPVDMRGDQTVAEQRVTARAPYQTLPRAEASFIIQGCSTPTTRSTRIAAGACPRATGSTRHATGAVSCPTALGRSAPPGPGPHGRPRSGRRFQSGSGRASRHTRTRPVCNPGTTRSPCRRHLVHLIVPLGALDHRRHPVLPPFPRTYLATA
jgi:hypothetical protein